MPEDNADKQPPIITPDVVRKVLEGSPVYTELTSIEGREVLEEMVLRLGDWIEKRFLDIPKGKPDIKIALKEFKSSPMWETDEGEDEAPSACDFFAEELLKYPFGIYHQRVFLQGVFKRLYFKLGGEKLAKLPWE